MQLLLAVLLLLISDPVEQWQRLEAEAIRAGARATAGALEQGLPEIPIEQWLREMAGPGASARWEAHDCGEQTGNPEQDKDRDFPVCAEVFVTAVDGLEVGVSLAVGTVKTGISGPRELAWVTYRRGGEWKGLKKLGDVRGLFRKRN